MTNKKILMAGIAAAGLAFTSTAASAATSNLTIDALVVEAITLDCTGTPLEFGTLDAAGAAVVTVDTADGRTDDVAGAALVTDAGNTPTSGVCAIDGSDGQVVDVNIPDTTIINGGDNFAIDNYTFAGTGAAGAAGNDFTITLPAGGSQNYTIGGDLTITGGEAAGAYTGTSNVTVSYQ